MMSKEVKEVKAEKSASQKISTAGGFIAGGLAACGAVTFTNPIELVKTRMQLQGELSHSNQAKVYKNPIQALGKIYSNEGIKGVQKGLVCAYIYQIGLNGCRLGLYEPSRNILNSVFYPSQDPHSVQNVPINVAAGALSGIAGAIIGSPLFLIKTRMQSYSTKIAIGEQTHYKNFLDGLVSIYSKEGGIPGLFRGVDAAIIRTGMGSSVQLPIYNYLKQFLQKNEIVSEGAGLHLISSTFAGFGVGIVMNPGDVVLTRMYNQKGDLYKGPIDCFIKTIKYEGVFALYKGFGAQLLRIAPHTILTLTFMEQTMKLMQTVEQRFLA
ncbi:Mitochondrial oxaloacetate transport protein [Wickerhamomyces ciferrii]|uniref:Mitochondrial oxaloacetate transport protein n=1 Tax=Wickerhamomyces ciferrii (strain ATCC 14091 / BCRC 22168 / CBS 111 / JCM 3599 / NBRC 0793 / NRRL Y-1031 F-60-10) TaxID=1206466 RepID=K0KLW0_WICCF|nr:Mitochondrial oxaloacetate transport protein [Wickerhamomyces ciferrii]CCH42324.1 Mitochondrial oxaloacetate transport protein [Wickerhamomyces ciferrii]